MKTEKEKRKKKKKKKKEKKRKKEKRKKKKKVRKASVPKPVTPATGYHAPAPACIDGWDGWDGMGWTEYQKCPLKIFILCWYIDKVYTYLYM